MQTPSTKVTTFTAAAAMAAILCWVVASIWHIEVPDSIQAAISIVTGFILAYLVPEKNPANSAKETIAQEQAEANT